MQGGREGGKKKRNNTETKRIIKSNRFTDKEHLTSHKNTITLHVYHHKNLQADSKKVVFSTLIFLALFTFRSFPGVG